jgi:LysM repeat protein
MPRISFLVSILLAFALAAVVLAAALLVGLFPAGPGGVANGSPRPSVSFPAVTFPPSASPTTEPTSDVTAPPDATHDPSVEGTYTVQPGDFLSGIGDQLGEPWQLIAEANNIEPPDYLIVPGQVLIIPAVAVPTGGAGADFYVVQSGDTITGIAQQAGIDPTDLADFNNIADWNSIRVGDILYIPGSDWQTPLPLPSGF